jgi:hypothetical protein
VFFKIRIKKKLGKHKKKNHGFYQTTEQFQPAVHQAGKFEIFIKPSHGSAVLRKSTKRT